LNYFQGVSPTTLKNILMQYAAFKKKKQTKNKNKTVPSGGMVSYEWKMFYT